MSEKEQDGPFYINYLVNGEHFMVGPYRTRRFALIHMDDVRRIPGATNVYLGKKPPKDKSYAHLLPITATVATACLSAMAMRIDILMVPDWLGLWLYFAGAC